MTSVARFLVVVALGAGALATPATAHALWYYLDTLGNYGDLAQGSSNDPDCIWYRGSAGCTGWNYWDYNEGETTQGQGTILVGFENDTTIRGREIGTFDYTVEFPSWWGMGGYLKCHVTWWSGSYVRTHAYSFAG